MFPVREQEAGNDSLSELNLVLVFEVKKIRSPSPCAAEYIEQV